jgi:hypothetical protein
MEQSLEKNRVVELVKKFPVLHGMSGSVSMFTRAVLLKLNRAN